MERVGWSFQNSTLESRIALKTWRQNGNKVAVTMSKGHTFVLVTKLLKKIQNIVLHSKSKSANLLWSRLGFSECFSKPINCPLSTNPVWFVERAYMIHNGYCTELQKQQKKSSAQTELNTFIQGKTEDRIVRSNFFWSHTKRERPLSGLHIVSL